ncbi:MAG: ferrochelatase [Rhodospirillales bacterium]|nr:ferrochelatase [Rhodospirillales bacterium]
MGKRIAIVLFNLGGPDSPEAVQPFLFNLFFDPAIIRLPLPLRWLLARFISKRRAPIARDIYDHLGGKSPILELTENQARALEVSMGDDTDIKCFVAMRYWHPMTLQAAEQVKKFDPDSIVLLPLYPQYSSTTTGSSFKEWKRAAKFVGLNADSYGICCYPTMAGWIDAQTQLIAAQFEQVKNRDQIRLLFSAHGLPKKIIDGGDPYQFQVEKTVSAVIENLDFPVTDWAVCYQSKVGRLEWIGPSLDDEIHRAAEDGVGLIIVPIAFVSEHSETLVELDIEYSAMARQLKIPEYHRVPAVAAMPAFIDGLADMVRTALDRKVSLSSCQINGARLCPAVQGECPLKNLQAN